MKHFATLLLALLLAPLWSTDYVGLHLDANNDPTPFLAGDRWKIPTATGGYFVTVEPGVQTATRVVSHPVMSSDSVYAVSAAAGTAGRVAFWTTNGLLLDSANLAWNNSTNVLGVGGTVAVTQGAITSAAAAIGATTTWNNGAVTFDGLSFIATLTANSADSRLLNLQTGSGRIFSVIADGSMIFAGAAAAQPSSTYDTSAIIQRTGNAGSAPYNQAGSIVYRPQVSAVAGRSSHYFYTGSPSTLRTTIDETGILTHAGNIAQTGATTHSTGTGTFTHNGPTVSTSSSGFNLISGAPLGWGLTDAATNGDLDFPGVSTQAATLRIFRDTNTAGARSFIIYRGDGSATTSLTVIPGTSITFTDPFTSNGAANFTGNIAQSGATTLSTGTGVGTYNHTSETHAGHVTIAASMRLMVQGASSVQSDVVGGLATPTVQNSGTASSVASQSRWSNNTGAPHFVMGKSRGATVGTFAIVSDGDPLGYIQWNGDDGVQMRRSATIYATVNGTPGSGDMPGKLWFGTTIDGSSAPTDWMSINAAGQVAVLATTDATSTTTGGFITASGVGIAKAAYIGGLLDVASTFSQTLTDSTTTTISDLHTFRHNGGTVATGFGTGQQWLLESDSTNNRNAARWTVEWATATDASRKARVIHYAYDTSAREALRLEASGSAAMVGFLGASAVIRQAGTGETAGFTAGAGTPVLDDSTFTGNVGATAYRINDIVKALKNYGLLAQ